MATDLRGLVDTDRGMISKQIFIEPDLYQKELEQIFARCWLFLCHESQIPNPGDFFPPTWVRTPCSSCVTLMGQSVRF